MPRIANIFVWPTACSPRKARPLIQRALMEMANVRGTRLIVTEPIVFTLLTPEGAPGPSLWIASGEVE